MRCLVLLLVATTSIALPVSAREWRCSVGGFLYSPPLVTTDRVLQSSSSGVLMAVNRSNGILRWSEKLTTAPLNATSVLEAEDLILTPSVDGRIYANRMTDGSARWVFDGGAPIYSGVAIDAKLLYCGNGAGELFAVDRMGKEAWRVNLGGAILGRPALSGDRLFVYLDGTALVACKATDGSQIWTSSVVHIGTSDGPVVVGSRVYLSCEGSRFCAFNTADGTAEWTADLPSLATTGIAASNGSLFIGSADGNLTALSATNGNVLWQTQIGGFLRATPVIGGDSLFVGSDSGVLTTIDVKTGTIEQMTDLGEPISTAVSHQGGTTYISLAAGTLIAMD